jgi:release factor glutamine methyltransferase
LIRQALAEAAQRSPRQRHPRLDAELLMAHALGVDAAGRAAPPPRRSRADGFEPLVQRRLAHEPIAYITGTRAFWTIELQVGPGALIPRPDSETLIEAAIEHFDERAPATILDLGTGPGTLAARRARPMAGREGAGIDASERALDYARANAERLGMADRAESASATGRARLEGPLRPDPRQPALYRHARAASRRGSRL